MHPAPGTATVEEVLAYLDGEKRLCELVDGVLVEKAMGFYESLVAGVLIGYLHVFLSEQNLGVVLGADGTVRLIQGLVRIPDVAFFSWRHFPNRKLPRRAIPQVVPDLAVEVLSESNTETEMARKLQEYFGAGVSLVWYADPETRTVRVFTSPSEVSLLGEEDTIDGGTVLPGFRLSIREWFERAGEREEE
jgi:Uma2 family endonuclease